MKKIKICYVGPISDLVGIQSEEIVIEENKTIMQLIEEVVNRRPLLKKIIKMELLDDPENSPVMIAVNNRLLLARQDFMRILNDGDVVILSYPLVGG